MNEASRWLVWKRSGNISPAACLGISISVLLQLEAINVPICSLHFCCQSGWTKDMVGVTWMAPFVVSIVNWQCSFWADSCNLTLILSRNFAMRGSTEISNEWAEEVSDKAESDRISPTGDGLVSSFDAFGTTPPTTFSTDMLAPSVVWVVSSTVSRTAKWKKCVIHVN